MAIKDQRTNKYAGAIGIVAPSNARVNRKQQESEFFANMADKMELTTECFASPLNNYLDNYW